MEGMRIWPASLLMSWVSTLIIRPAHLFTYKFGRSISKTSSILLAIIVKDFSFLNYSWRSGNCTFIMWVSKAFAPWVLPSKLETYLEKDKDKFMQHHLTAEIFRVIMAPFSFEKRRGLRRNHALVGWLIWRRLVGETLGSHWKPWLLAYLPWSTIFDWNSALNSILLSIDDGPWGFFPDREAVFDLLLGGVIKG